MTRFSLAVIALLFSGLGCAGDAPRISQDALLAKLSAGDPDLVVLDVRTAQEYDQGHVPGALNISHDALESQLGRLAADRDKEVVVYCRSGRRAELALGVLEKAGFKRLYHLDGDYAGWQAARRPVQKAPPPEPAPDY